ncbi:hypothetical protein BH24ACT26_BH24ACT26_12670 [soil metagenome]
MTFADLIAEQRDKHVFGYARPHLEGDEEVIQWARAWHPDEDRQGYVYLTSHKLLVVWSGHSDGHGAISWSEIHSWGVDAQAGGGPLLGIESGADKVFVHMPVASRGTARRVTSFLRKFARLAPPSSRGPSRASHSGSFHPDPAIEVTLEKMSARALTKRVIVTMVGLTLFFGGLAIVPIPGPWSLPLVLAGLAVLSSEYDWAKDALDWAKDRTRATREKLKARRAER